jgi:hypothetical protein
LVDSLPKEQKQRATLFLFFYFLFRISHLKKEEDCKKMSIPKVVVGVVSSFTEEGRRPQRPAYSKIR